MTKQHSPVHIDSPIDDVDEIPYERSEMGPGKFGLTVDFSREELDLLRRAHGPGPGLIRFVKAAALEVAGREIKDKSGDGLHAAD